MMSGVSSGFFCCFECLFECFLRLDCVGSPQDLGGRAERKILWGLLRIKKPCEAYHGYCIPRVSLAKPGRLSLHPS